MSARHVPPTLTATAVCAKRGCGHPIYASTCGGVFPQGVWVHASGGDARAKAHRAHPRSGTVTR